MNDLLRFLPYLLVCAGVTYLVRMLPLVLVKGRITNRFVCSFLYYVPYSVLAVMTVPAIFTSTATLISAFAGFLVAVILAFFERGLLTVAAASCATAFAVELILSYIPQTAC